MGAAKIQEPAGLSSGRAVLAEELWPKIQRTPKGPVATIDSKAISDIGTWRKPESWNMAVLQPQTQERKGIRTNRLLHSLLAINCITESSK